MAGTGPKTAATPLELLTDNRVAKPPFLNDVWGYLVGGFIGLGGSLYGNFTTKRPLLAGKTYPIFSITIVYIIQCTKINIYFSSTSNRRNYSRCSFIREIHG